MADVLAQQEALLQPSQSLKAGAWGTQAGMAGLEKGIHRYDPGRGTRFSTCAFWWIRAAMSKAHARVANVIQYGPSAGTELRAAIRKRAQLAEAAGRCCACPALTADARGEGKEASCEGCKIIDLLSMFW